MNRRDLIFACAVLAASPALAADWPTEPAAIVGKLYSFYAGGADSGKTAYGDAGVRKRYFAPSLNALIEKAEAKSRRINEPIIDFDPIIGGQDWDKPKDMTIAIETPGDRKTTVRARYKVFDARQTTRFDFVRENGAWRIFDIRGESGGQTWSLRKIATGG